jgi:hypothetical protein
MISVALRGRVSFERPQQNARTLPDKHIEAWKDRGRRTGNFMKDQFRGLRWDPTNEQEVVMLFGQLIDHLPRPLAVEFIHTTFPDCKAIALDRDGHESIWIEFEVFASDYRPHLHRHDQCDWIVCWHNDIGNAPGTGWPRIVALDEIVRGLPKQYVGSPRPPSMSDEEYFQLRIRALTQHHQWAIRQLLDFAGTPDLGLRIKWPPTNGACFTVLQGTIELFKVGADGRIGTPFSRWKNRVSAEAISQVVSSLNRVLGKTWFRAGGKLGADIAQAMPDRETVGEFIGVWRNFVRANTRMHQTALGDP